MSRIHLPSDPAKRLSFVALSIVVVIAVIFVLGGLCVTFTVAWELLASIQSPAGAYPPGTLVIRWVLSCVGYLALPAVIGVLAAAASEAFLVQRRLTDKQAREAAMKEVSRLLGLPREKL